MEPELIVRPLGEEDVDAAATIETLCFTDPWSRDSLYWDITDNPAALYLGAYVEGKMIGFGGVWCVLDESFISTICIVPSARRMGAGSFLLESLMHAARAMGARDMTLEVRVSNAVAQRMYQNHGFTSVGLRKKYYSDNGEDAYIMWCRLEDCPREENPV